MNRSLLKVVASITLGVMAGEALANNLLYMQRIKGMVAIEWTQSDPFYGEWTDVGSLYGCANWSPATSTVTAGQAFTQTATDCEQDQSRTRQDREVESNTGEIRNVGTPVTEARIVTASSTRQAVGTKESWVAITPSYSSWVNVGSVYNCTAWDPATSTVWVGNTFTQYRTCYQSQQRTVQNREQEQTSGQIRNTTTTEESGAITVSQNQRANGTKKITQK